MSIYSKNTKEEFFAPVFNIQLTIDQSRFNGFAGGDLLSLTEIINERAGEIDRFTYVGKVVEGTTIQDHQGHIIPGNIIWDVYQRNQAALDVILDQILVLIRPQIERFVPFNSLLLPGSGVLPLKSIIIWNPVNICSAPHDVNRVGYPKHEIDFEVISKLYEIYQHETELPVVRLWVEALKSVKKMKRGIDHTESIEVYNFLVASLNLLLEILGDRDNLERFIYHSFRWESVQNIDLGIPVVKPVGVGFDGDVVSRPEKYK